jgi:hypothetical protein
MNARLDGTMNADEWSIAVQESNVQRLNDFMFYELGMRLAPLEEITSESLYRDVLYDLMFARRYTRYILRNFPLSICQTTGKELIDAITLVVPEDFDQAMAKEMDTQVGYRCHAIREGKVTFEHVLSAELSSFGTYFLTPLGIYNTADLVDHADKSFSNETSAVITDDAKKDFRQGGRCLAFELPTASGFHTTRATEAVLRQYYKAVFSTATQVPKMACCVNELKKAGEDPKLMNILDSFRDLHRNPQMHPDAFLSMEEASRLFDISKTAINAMSDRIAALMAHAKPSPATNQTGILGSVIASLPASANTGP